MTDGIVRVLHIEGDLGDVRLFREYLGQSPGQYRVETANRLSDGLQRLSGEQFDIVLMDLRLPDDRGIDAFKRIHSADPGIPIIVLGRIGDEKLAVRAVHEGAQDYLIKDDFSARALARSIDYAIERKQSENRVLRLNKILMSIREIHRLILRHKDENVLLGSACNILHEVGGFEIVWIGLLDKTSPRIIPAAAAGIEIEFLNTHQVTRDKSSTGQGPSGTVTGRKKTCVFTDLSEDRFDAWRETIIHTGITSCVASPLMIDGRVHGVLNVYSRGPDPFDNDEVALIEEITGDISFAISNILTGRDRDSMEKALRESEERYRALLDNLNDAVFNVDAEGRVTYFSPIVTQMSGYSPEEIVGKHFTDFLDEHEATVVSGHFEDLLSGKAALFEIKLKDRWGKDHCYRISSRLQRRDGEVIGIGGVMSDITETRRAQEALREQAEILDQIHDIVITTDLRGTITSWNKGAERALGYRAQEMLGKPVLLIYPEKEYEATRKRTIEGLRGNGEITDEFTVKRKDGSELPVHLTLTIRRDRDGKTSGIIGSAVDITERKKAEEALRESEQRYRILAENATDVIFMLDMDLRTTYISPSVTWLRGYAPEEAMAQTPGEALTPGSLAVAMEALRKELDIERQRNKKLDRTRVLELEETCKDGSTVWTETTFSMLRDGQGTLTGFLGITRDISDRKRAQDALSESEQRYRSLFDHNPDAVFSLDMKGNYRSVNQSTCRGTGYSRNELLSMSFDQLVAPESLDETRSRFTETTGGKTQYYESCIVTKDQRRVYIAVTNTPIVINGEIVGVYGIATDITDRKHAEEALRASEEKYRIVVESGNEAIVVAQDNVLKFVNSQAGRLSGYSRDELLGRSFVDLIHPDDRVALRERRENVLKGASPSAPARYRIHHRNGEIRWIETAVVVIEWEGRPATLVFAHDITEKNRAEEALRESEQRFRTLFESAKDAVMIVTAEGRIVAMNPAGRELLGYTEEEINAVNAADFYVKPEDREVFRQQIESQGYIKDLEITYLRKDGTLVDCLETATVVRDAQGNIVGYQGTVKDMTEHKRLEQRLIQAEKLSSLGGMISGVAHELNNPLTSIIGNTQLLMRKELPPDSMNKLEVIQRESVRCTRIVGSLLSFAREHKPERRMIDVNTVIIESLKLREYDLRVNNIRVSTDLAGDIPETSADPYQLQQVFINLINNSHDALRENGGGTLSIRSSCVEGFIHVEFADDGPGIEPGDLHRIFDPFFTTKDVGKGTGLGLSIAYGIVNEHGGTIEVESRPGKGSRFIVAIPVIEQDEQTAVDEASPSPEGTGRKKGILIVEDEESLRKFMAEALVGEGYRVRGVPRAEDAIELLKTLRFDLIITDLKMPGIGGRELYTYVRKNVPAYADRMLFITGDVLSKETRHFLEAANNPYLEKPFDLERLFLTIRRFFAA